MSKKKKVLIGVIGAIVGVCLLARVVLMIAILVSDKDENYEETTTSAVAVQIPEENETTTEPWVIEPQFIACIKTPKGFIEKDFTAATVENLADVKTMKVSDGKAEEVSKFEVRLYGVPLGAQVIVTCESMATKAYKVNVGQNDGSYQYYYWQQELYAASKQGEYTFKVEISKTTDKNEKKTVIYYKMAV